jgi:site-specific DNA-adenine methylase
MGDVTFICANFLYDDPPEANMLIYCDPPYFGATEYRGIPQFDHDAFWARVIELEQAGHTVLVSEYVAPDGFTCILEMPSRLSVGDSRKWRTEKLFRYGDHAPFQPRLI